MIRSFLIGSVLGALIGWTLSGCASEPRTPVKTPIPVSTPWYDKAATDWETLDDAYNVWETEAIAAVELGCSTPDQVDTLNRARNIWWQLRMAAAMAIITQGEFKTTVDEGEKAWKDVLVASYSVFSWLGLEWPLPTTPVPTRK